MNTFHYLKSEINPGNPKTILKDNEQHMQANYIFKLDNKGLRVP